MRYRLTLNVMIDVFSGVSLGAEALFSAGLILSRHCPGIFSPLGQSIPQWMDFWGTSRGERIIQETLLWGIALLGSIAAQDYLRSAAKNMFTKRKTMEVFDGEQAHGWKHGGRG